MIEVKRIEAVNRSPIYSHISASLYGLPTIRSIGVESLFKRDLESHQVLCPDLVKLLLTKSVFI